MSNTLNTPNASESSYADLDSLPRVYDSETAKENGDVVCVHGNNYNIEKLEQFIEKYKDGKANPSDMIRVITYTVEGDAIVQDLTVIDDENMKLIMDYTRDNFGPKYIKEHNIVDIFTKEENNYLHYVVRTDENIDITICYERMASEETE
jgi:hypothetical protein